MGMSRVLGAKILVEFKEKIVSESMTNNVPTPNVLDSAATFW